MVGAVGQSVAYGVVGRGGRGAGTPVVALARGRGAGV